MEVVGDGVEGQDDQEEAEHPLQARNVRAPDLRQKRRVDVRKFLVGNEPIVAVNEAVRPVVAFLLEDVMVLALVFQGIADVLVLLEETRRHGDRVGAGGNSNFIKLGILLQSFVFRRYEGIERNEIVVYALPVDVRRDKLGGGAECQEKERQEYEELLGRSIT